MAGEGRAKKCAPLSQVVRPIISSNRVMKRYLPHLIATALIICVWFVLAWFAYPKIKNQLTKRNIYLLFLLLGLVIGTLAFTYFQTGGTFIW
jgi:hypothetical protein